MPKKFLKTMPGNFRKLYRLALACLLAQVFAGGLSTARAAQECLTEAALRSNGSAATAVAVLVALSEHKRPDRLKLLRRLTAPGRSPDRQPQPSPQPSPRARDIAHGEPQTTIGTP
jgi:hypothetical protein